jgi:integrase
MMGVMGWSNTAMTHRYAHMVDPVRRDIAQRLDGLLWGAGKAADADPDDPRRAG